MRTNMNYAHNRYHDVYMVCVYLILLWTIVWFLTRFSPMSNPRLRVLQSAVRRSGTLFNILLLFHCILTAI